MMLWQIRGFETGAAGTLKKFVYLQATSGRPLPLRALFRWHHALASRWHLPFGPKKKPWLPPSPS